MIQQVMFEQHLDIPVTLTRYKPDSYVVQYGAERRECSSYSEAAHELGECLMHSLACAGNMENA